MTTKQQKIEGEWEEKIESLIERILSSRALHEDIRQFIKSMKTIISTEIEKAKAEGYKEGFDCGEAAVEGIATYEAGEEEIQKIRASERQRCVEETEKVIWDKLSQPMASIVVGIIRDSQSIHN